MFKNFACPVAGFKPIFIYTGIYEFCKLIFSFYLTTLSTCMYQKTAAMTGMSICS